MGQPLAPSPVPVRGGAYDFTLRIGDEAAALHRASSRGDEAPWRSPLFAGETWFAASVPVARCLCRAASARGARPRPTSRCAGRFGSDGDNYLRSIARSLEERAAVRLMRGDSLMPSARHTEYGRAGRSRPSSRSAPRPVSTMLPLHDIARHRQYEAPISGSLTNRMVTPC